MSMDSDPRFQFPRFISFTLQTTSHEVWQVLISNNLASIVGTGSKLDHEIASELIALIGAGETNYRTQCDFKGAALLAGIFYDEKTIGLFTPRLGHELFLVQELSENLLAFDEAKNEFRELKRWTEKTASLAGKDFPSQHDLITKANKLEPLLLSDSQSKKMRQRQNQLMQELKGQMGTYRAPLFERFSDIALGLTAKYALLRVHLLKFLAILPGLDHDKSGDEVKRILMESLRRLVHDSRRARSLAKTGQERPLPRWMQEAILVANFLGNLCPAGPLAMMVRASVKIMARRFIAGESIDRAQEGLGGLLNSKRDATLDQLGELVVSSPEADRYAAEVISIIGGMKQYIKRGEKNQAGILRAHVSIKVSALAHDFRPEAMEETYNQVAPRLIKILTVAKKEVVFINIDAEHYHFRDVVFQIYARVLQETPELFDYADTGIVLQAYLQDAFHHLKDIVALAKSRKLIMPIRLVKGAYWDAETVEADAHSYVAPQFLNKEETDLYYRQLTWEIFKNYPHVQICLAGHNLADHAWAVALREEHFSSLPVIEHQCLHMTYEALSLGMSRMGWVVRNYVPVGSLLVGMAYLVRRIMENSSQVGVLTIMRSHKKKGVLPAPEIVHLENKEKGLLARDKTHKILTHEFFNVAPVRLYRPHHLKAVQAAFNLQKTTQAKRFGESPWCSGEWQKIFSSSDPSLLVGEIRFANAQDVTKAVEASDSYYNLGVWATAHWTLRASVILTAARTMLARRHELSALISFEAGKAPKESYGDVDEAIDFLNFYAREEGRLHHGVNQLKSRGVAAIVTPWNFPLAIPCGMVVGPLIAGNNVILKSAEQTPLIAQVLVDILHESGVPKKALIHLPGAGETVGDALINHARVALVVFTGSKNVGLYLQQKVSTRLIHNQLNNMTYPAKVVTEMGGKNAIIVTSNAELDETVSGILASAFGHAGQKCSAASRVIVHESVRLKLLQRLQEACRDLKVGQAWDFSTWINPVISAEDKLRLQKSVEEAAEEARLTGGKVWVDRTKEEMPGYCIGPAIIELSLNHAMERKSFACRELFGPVLHVIGYRHNHEAIVLFNVTEYALTGGLYSQSQDDIDYFTSRMLCGNVYINRPITGARVGIEPFGGFKLSGTGPKAGGHSYQAAFHIRPVNNPALSQLVKKTPVDEKGEDYRFDLCRPSGLSLEKRLARLERALEILLNNFESLFQGIYGENKKILTEYKRWSKRELPDLLESPQPNVSIPGQMSFNRLNLSHQHLIVCAYECRAFFASLMYVLTALSTGVGVTVLARNQSAYLFWGQLKRIFTQAGIGSFNFDVYFSSEKLLKDAVLHPEVALVLVDGDLPHYEKVAEMVFHEPITGVWTKTLLGPYDAPMPNDFNSYVETFTLVRSFAINTMRHGAPLDVELT